MSLFDILSVGALAASVVLLFDAGAGEAGGDGGDRGGAGGGDQVLRGFKIV